MICSVQPLECAWPCSPKEQTSARLDVLLAKPAVLLIATIQNVPVPQATANVPMSLRKEPINAQPLRTAMTVPVPVVKAMPALQANPVTAETAVISPAVLIVQWDPV